MQIDNIKLEWLGHASFRFVSDNKVIYLDPFKLNTEEKADIILITHGHYDHCSIEDLQKIVKEDTIILSSSDCISKFAGKIEPQFIFV